MARTSLVVAELARRSGTAIVELVGGTGVGAKTVVIGVGAGAETAATAAAALECSRKHFEHISRVAVLLHISLKV